LETVLDRVRMPPGVITAATATTVKKTRAVKTRLGTRRLETTTPDGPGAFNAQRACTARGEGPTQEDAPWRIIQAIVARSSSCFSVVTASAWSNARRRSIHLPASPAPA